MTSTKISVIIPTRHRDDLLALCLDRLAPGAQTLPTDRYEVVVTDDGSASTAEAMLREKYPWAHWTVGPKRGPAANRNNGAKIAEGEWLAFTDDDCLPDTGWLAALLRATTDDVPVYEGRTTCAAGVRSPLMQAPVNETGGYLWSCNMMARRDVFEAMGGFDEVFPYAMMEDVDFRERLRERGQPFLFVKDAVVDHPPRPRASPARIAASHESFVISAYKRGWPTSSLPVHLRSHLSFELGRIRSSPLGRDTLPALRDLVVETVLIGAQLQGWKKKHRAMKEDALRRASAPNAPGGEQDAPSGEEEICPKP